MADVIVGIDLGTTNSEVAALVEGKIHVLATEGEQIMPSVVGVSPEGTLLVGTPARNQYVVYPERTVKSIKRLMGTDQRVAMGGQTYSPPEISALILRALKTRAEAALGMPVRRAVITVPAYFSDAQRQATRDAGENQPPRRWPMAPTVTVSGRFSSTTWGVARLMSLSCKCMARSPKCWRAMVITISAGTTLTNCWSTLSMAASWLQGGRICAGTAKR